LCVHHIPHNGDEEWPAFVAPADQLVHVLRPLGCQRAETEVVEDEQVHVAQLVEAAAEAAIGPGGIELTQEPLQGALVDAVVALERLKAQSIHQMRLAHSGGAAQKQVLPLDEVGTGSQLKDEAAIELG